VIGTLMVYIFRMFVAGLLVIYATPICKASQQWEVSASEWRAVKISKGETIHGYWSLNGSLMVTITTVSDRNPLRIIYLKPRESLSKRGVSTGTWYFVSKTLKPSSSQTILGEARLFSRNCSQPLSFPAKLLGYEESRLIIQGLARVRDGCKETGQIRELIDTLDGVQKSDINFAP
jgi:hypothetical protein